jgi:hypothetical protein
MSLEDLEGKYISGKLGCLKDSEGFSRPFMGFIKKHIHSGFFLIEISEDPKMDLSGPMILESVNGMVDSKFFEDKQSAQVFFEDSYEDYNKERVEE